MLRFRMDAVVIAAGEGTRLRPLTSTRPKPMLPVAGKPILEWNLEALAGNGFRRVVLIVGYRKETISDYFGKRFNGIRLHYIEQKEQLGTAHALSLAEGEVGENFLAINGDLIPSEKLISRFLSCNRKAKSENSICFIEVDNPSEFGIISLKGNRVSNLVEKPKNSVSNLANAGIYSFNSKIFDAIRGIERSTRLEYELTDALKTLIKKKEVHGFECDGHWIDIGRPWDLLDANEMLLKTMEFKKENADIEKFAVVRGRVRIGRGSVIKSGSYIEGPCWIGENCTIGPNCHIRPYSSIGDNVHIGNAVEIKNSIVMNSTRICHLSYIGDSIIGEGCNFGAGTKVANLRVDDEDVRIEIKSELTASGRRKFGCLMGDKVKTGINVSIMPGRAIYPEAYVEAGGVVRNTIYKEKEE